MSMFDVLVAEIGSTTTSMQAMLLRSNKCVQASLTKGLV